MRFVRQRQSPSPSRIFILVLCGYIVYLYFIEMIINTILDSQGQTIGNVYKQEEYIKLQNMLLKDKIVKETSFNTIYSRALHIGFIPLSPSKIQYINSYR